MYTIFTVILNYNNFIDTCECVNSILALPNTSVWCNKIVLVDNCSTDGSGAELLKKYNEAVTVIVSDKNFGYAAGNNIGIEYARKQNADFICVLNNDTIIEQEFYTACIEAFDNMNVGIVSPVIEDYYTKKVQSSGGNINFYKGDVSVKNYGVERSSLPAVIESDYIGGACLFFKTNLINKIGFIPENYFLFFEETEWCWKAKCAGLSNLCLSNIYIRHKGSASIDTINGLHSYLMERNRAVFLKRNAPKRAILAIAISYLCLKYIKKGIFDNKEYFKYIEYLHDGLKNRVDTLKYPFIIFK